MKELTRYFYLSDYVLSYSDSPKSKSRKLLCPSCLTHRSFNLQDVITVNSPSKRFVDGNIPNKSVVDLVFRDNSILTVAASRSLPDSSILLSKVLSVRILNRRY